MLIYEDVAMNISMNSIFCESTSVKGNVWTMEPLILLEIEFQHIPMKIRRGKNDR